MDETTNPYAAPNIEGDEPDVSATPGGYTVDGQFLVVGREARLPKRCILTNKPGEKSVTAKLDFTPSFRIVVFRKRCRIHHFLSRDVFREQRNTRLKQRIYAITVFALLTLFMVNPVNLLGSQLMILVVPLLVVFTWLLTIANRGRRRLTVKRFNNGKFWIDGCCPEFLAEIQRDQRSTGEPN